MATVAWFIVPIVPIIRRRFSTRRGGSSEYSLRIRPSKTSRQSLRQACKDKISPERESSHGANSKNNTGGYAGTLHISIIAPSWSNIWTALVFHLQPSLPQTCEGCSPQRAIRVFLGIILVRGRGLHPTMILHGFAPGLDQNRPERASVRCGCFERR